MDAVVSYGQVVILNGAPRSGKSSIAEEIQRTFDGPWINLGVDNSQRSTPPGLQPGIGLRPGENDHPASPYVPVLYAALYDSVAAHVKLGLNVVVDVGHYRRDLLSDAARRLDAATVFFVGVDCPLEEIMRRRQDSEPGRYVVAASDEPIPAPVLRWQAEVHGDWEYDLRVDTSKLDPSQCATAISERIVRGPAPTALSSLLNDPRN